MKWVLTYTYPDGRCSTESFLDSDDLMLVIGRLIEIGATFSVVCNKLEI